jgi:hypothetical protein
MFLTKMQKVAKKLIDKFGSDVAIIEVIRDAYNPDTGEMEEFELEHPTKAHISNFDTSLVVAGVVNMEDLKLLCYNFDNILPEKGWYVDVQGKRLTVISVNNVVTAQNGFITFELQCRV